MQTRREQVRAYRFVTRRIVSAMLSGEPETADLPMRRLALALFGSAMIATIVFAGVGVYGLLRPGGGTPTANALIIEKETGARYVYLDNVLYPVLNYTSARLILGIATPTVKSMSHQSLRGLPRGRTVGITGAPDALPDRAALVGLPWSVCSAPRSVDLPTPASHLFIGSVPDGGAALGESALLVNSDGDQNVRYLLWHDHRLRIKDRSVLASLSMSAATPVTVSDALLNAVTPGPDLAPVTPEDAGKPSGHQVGGQTAKIGQLYHLEDQHFVMLAAGLVPISDVVRLLLTVGGQEAEISPADVARTQVDTRLEPDGYPTKIPALHQVAGDQPAVCAAYRGGDATHRDVAVEMFDTAPGTLTLPPGDGTYQIVNGQRLVDRIVVRGGQAALVQQLPAPNSTATGATVYVVTDQGVKYAIPTRTADAMTALGYQGLTATPVPAALLALVPTGPSLDPAAAKSFTGRPAPGPTRSPTPKPKASGTPTPGSR